MLRTVQLAVRAAQGRWPVRSISSHPWPLPAREPSSLPWTPFGLDRTSPCPWSVGLAGRPLLTSVVLDGGLCVPRRGYRATGRCHNTTPPSPDEKEKAAATVTPSAEEKLSLWKRFKKMYREYWYVLVPVHVATSLVWFGSFYYAAVSGIDIVAVLESLGAGDRITGPIGRSGAGHVAVAYALYKIATPARYAVTLGGTTVSITYLKQWGVIKPAPGPAELKAIVRAKRLAFQDKMRAKRLQFQEQMKANRLARAKRKEQRRRHKNGRH